MDRQPAQNAETVSPVRTMLLVLAFAFLATLAIVSLPFAAVAKLVLREASAPRRARMLDLSRVEAGS